MKVLGIFRGFPGLGRVVSGISILETLRDKYGFKVKAVSYLQGNKYLESRGFDILSDVTCFDYCSIGLLPTNHFAKEINLLIKEFAPDIIIVDGEPLIIQSLRISYPKNKIVALLNPSDVDNEANDLEAMDYFNASYQLADLAIVHGNRIIETKRNYKKIISIPTIIRDEITKLQRRPNNTIYCILGGGTLNVGTQFYESTIQIGTLCIEVSAHIPEYKFIILCSCLEVYEALLSLNHSSNVFLEKEIVNATEYYTNASMIITRSGRNTLGEVFYLGIPTITFVSGCEYRRAEQLKNIESISTENIHCVSNDISIEELTSLIKLSANNQYKYRTINGVHLAIDAILALYRNYSNLNFYNPHMWINELKVARLHKDAKYKKSEFKRLRSLIFKENIKIISELGYRNSKGQWICIDTNEGSSELFQSELPQVTRKENYKTAITVVNDDSIDAGIKLVYQGLNPIILDMACSDGPGGGVIGGCYGQEESLFRRTDLYLHTFRYTKYAQVFGITESIKKYPLDKTFGAVYVRNANVFRCNESMGYQLMNTPCKLSFVAVAAIKDPILVSNELSENDIEITCSKIRTMFRISLQNNHDAIVLGAFGCGIFHNPPRSITKCFEMVINEPEFHNAFKKIVFAILEDQYSEGEHNKHGNYLPFYQKFCK